MAKRKLAPKPKADSPSYQRRLQRREETRKLAAAKSEAETRGGTLEVFDGKSVAQ